MVILFTDMIYLKITNSNKPNIMTIIILAISGIVNAFLYIIENEVMSKLLSFIIINIINGVVLFVRCDRKDVSFILTYMLAFIISYAFYVVTLILTGITFGIICPQIEISNIFCLILIVIAYILLFICFYRFKRIKNGFNFLKRINMNITVFVLLFCGVIVTILAIIPKNVNYKSQELVLIGTILISVSLLMIIKNQITKHYRSNMRDRTISVQKEEIDANEKEISELKEQNLKLAKTIHKYNHRLSSLENSIRKVIDNSNVEFASELSIVLEKTKKVGEQLSDETKVAMKLPTTNVLSVDNMLDYMKEEATKCGIDFALKVSDSVKILIDKYIAEDKFETLLGDHIKDAIIAINSKGEGYKSILVLIGIVDGAYELSIYDTGVEFDIPTLLKLGTEPITTHKNDGGSGLGFMTTFETLKSCKASLVIEEYDATVTNYTKSVTIRFDGKCEYRIYSYRADKIKSESNNRKIIIKSI